MPVRSLLRAAGAIVAVALLAVALAPAAASAERPPIRDCGDVSTLDRDGVSIAAVTAQGNVVCRVARETARDVAGSRACKRTGSCVVNRRVCLLAKAGKELTLVRCENSRQTQFIRFEIGA